MSTRTWHTLLREQSARRSNYLLQEEINVGTKIVFFREAEQIMTPVLTFNRLPLTPYHVERLGSTVILYFEAGTQMPARPNTWPNQLARQVYHQRRCGVEADGSIMVVCERVQS